MIPGRIDRATRYLGAPAGWEPPRDGPCAHLAIRDEQFSLNGPWSMVSAWELTPDEMERLKAAPIYLTVIGSSHPPVALSVGFPPRDEP